MFYIRPGTIVKFIIKVIIYFHLECIGEDISAQPVEIFSIPTKHLSTLTTKTFGIDDSVPKLASEFIVTISSKFYVRRRLIDITGRSPF